MYEIIGFENIDFTNESSGEVIHGTKFYLKSDPITKGGGHSVISKFFPTNRVKGIPKEGAICEFSFVVTSKGEARINSIIISA